MVSMKKFLLFAILASVLIGAVCVKAQEESKEGKEPAKEEASAEKADAGTEAEKPTEKPAEAESGHGGVADFGKRIISGFKKAGKTIFSHIPFLNHGTAAAAGAEKAEEASEGDASAEAGDEKAEEAKEEESTEKSA